MDLARYVETLNLFADENRIRLCALLRERELCVTDLVRITGLSQSRVSTHLGRLREGGIVRDRRQGPLAYYALADTLPDPLNRVVEQAAQSTDPTLAGDRKRLGELDDDRREGFFESFAGEMERHYSPGRTWQSLAAGLAALLRLGDVLDVGCGDGAVAECLVPHCRSLTLIDVSPRMIEAAKARLGKRGARAKVADAHDIPFEAASFDTVLLFHTLSCAEDPARALQECARVLRPGGRLVLLSLDRHEHLDVTAAYGERHPGFSPRSLRSLLSRAGLQIVDCKVACREPKKPHFQVIVAIADKG